MHSPPLVFPLLYAIRTHSTRLTPYLTMQYHTSCAPRRSPPALDTSATMRAQLLALRAYNNTGAIMRTITGQCHKPNTRVPRVQWPSGFPPLPSQVLTSINKSLYYSLLSPYPANFCNCATLEPKQVLAAGCYFVAPGCCAIAPCQGSQWNALGRTKNPAI
jgi:hypothetical protein